MTKQPTHRECSTGLFSFLKETGVKITPENHSSDNIIQESILGREWANQLLFNLAEHNKPSAEHSIRVSPE